MKKKDRGIRVESHCVPMISTSVRTELVCISRSAVAKPSSYHRIIVAVEHKR